MTSVVEVSLDVEKRLIREANKSPSRSRHAAVILDKSFEPICYGFNNGKRHAEVHAILKCLGTPKYMGKNPKFLLVVRVNNSRQFINSKPCKICQKVIDRVGLKAFHS